MIKLELLLFPSTSISVKATTIQCNQWPQIPSACTWANLSVFTDFSVGCLQSIIHNIAGKNILYLDCHIGYI